jgi:pimeloyl-ACP methyl ester carboxylesterase
VKNFKLTNLVGLLPLALAISACSPEPSTDLQDSIIESTAISNYDPGESVVPFPNDLLFLGSTDGTLNIPVDNPADLSDPQVALNALDGFSTVAPMTTGFTGPISAASLDGDSIKLYKVTHSPTAAPNNQGGAVISIDEELVYGVDYRASVSPVDRTGSTLMINPLKPFEPQTAYFVVITNDLQSDDGNPMGASGAYTFSKLTTPLEVGGVSQFRALTDEEAVALEPLRQLTSTSVATLLAHDSSLSANDLIISWSFTTQSIGNVLTTVRAITPAPPATSLAASAVTVGAFGPGRSPLGAANVFVGSLQLSNYYLTAPSLADPTAILTKPWQAATEFPPGSGLRNLTGANPLPAVTGPVTIPVMVTAPFDTVTFPKPWKTVIYQHGITRFRSDVLAIADSLAQAGFAVVAIDLPLHGLNSSSPFYQAGIERTFEVDFVGEDADGNVISEGPDGVVDSSGAHFLNLRNLLVSRDNSRQAAADLFALTKAIPVIDVDGDTIGGDLNVNDLYLVAHSLGAIVGTPFALLEPTVKDVVLANGGGSLAKILDGSANYSPTIVAGLASAGVDKGTQDYEDFLGAAQAVLDDADAINYSAGLAAKGEGVLFFEVVGGNSSPSDLTIPNVVPDGNDSSGTVPAPLAGTEPVLTLMGLTQRNATFVGAPPLLVSTKYVAGNHSSFLDPSDDAAVTTEMQTQMANFLGSGGAALVVTDPSVLQAP